MSQIKPDPNPKPNLEQPSDLRELEDGDWPAAIKPLHLKKIRAAAAKLEAAPTAGAEVTGADAGAEVGTEAGMERSVAAEAGVAAAAAVQADGVGIGGDVGGDDEEEDDDFFGEMDRGKKAAKEAAKAKKKGRQASLAPTQAWPADDLSPNPNPIPTRA